MNDEPFLGAWRMADGKPEIPSQAAVFAAWGERLQRGRVYAKNAKIHAKCAAVSGTLETITKRSKISKAYKPGDYIVQGIEGERYCVDGDVFHERYAHAFEPAESKALQAEGFRLYSATGRVWAHQLDEEACARSFPAGTCAKDTAGRACCGYSAGNCTVRSTPTDNHPRTGTNMGLTALF